MGEEMENIYTDNTLMPGASESMLEDWTYEFTFFPSEVNVLFALQICAVW